MKVLQVNCVYNTGSTGKIVYDIHTELQNSAFESIVCYGRGAKTSDLNVYKTCGELYSKFNNLISRFTGIMYGGCFFSTNRLIKIIRKENPDIVHLHCINGYFVNIYRLVEWLKNNDIKTVLTLHAEFMYTGGWGGGIDCNQWSTRTGCGHSKCPRYRAETKSLIFDRTHTMWKKMKKAFDGFKNENLIIVSVSPWLMKRAEQSSILANKQHNVIMNGLDTSVFHTYNTEKLRAELNLRNERIIFHATPDFNDDPNHIKGGYYIIKLAETLIKENVKIVVAGNHPENLKVPGNVILLGRVSDQKKLAQLYSMADVTALTSQKETFSMVCAESFCCGTPVVGFKAGGPETISLSEYSEFIEYGNIDVLRATLLKFLDKEWLYEKISEEAAEKFSKQNMTAAYLKIYSDLLGAN